jgi:hypothetical protein
MIVHILESFIMDALIRDRNVGVLLARQIVAAAS